jgi:hypothetical protein
MTSRRSGAAADVNAPIMEEGSRARAVPSLHESGGSDRGAKDPIARPTKRTVPRHSERSAEGAIVQLPSCPCFPIRGDLNHGPRSSVFEGGPTLQLRRQAETVSVGRRSTAPPSRRDGASDRLTGHGRAVTARTSAITDPVVVSDQPSGGSGWIDATNGRGGSASAETTSGRSTTEASRLLRP